MNPVLPLLATVVVLLALAYARAIYPLKRLATVALFPVILSLALLTNATFAPWLIAIDVLLAGVALVDLLSLPRRNWFECERTVGRIASLGKPHPVRLTISNRHTQAVLVGVRDDVPEECRATPEQFHVLLPPQSRASVNYHLAARRRGAFHLGAVYLRVTSRLGLWQRQLTYPAPSELHVYPDMQQMREYALLARTDRLSLLGVRRMRRVGQDNEFERLRDYAVDDNYKHIDWRSTARRNKLTVKDFQVNQSQRVIFLVDCGRMMTNTAAGLSLLDHALNAALMLGYVALNKGDSVGMLCFADDIQRYVPPRGGLNQMNQLLHAAFDRFPRLVESRYDEAFVYLNARCRKRSLVILLTNVVDEVNSSQVSRYLTSVVGRHLPLAVMLRDHAIFDAAAVAPDSDQALYRSAAANEIVSWRRGVLRDLEHQGVLSLDVFPEQMTAPLVNRYLEIKARHLL
ncbi:MAG: DUF58 domain-containing protein [Pirellulales bacterium]